MRDLSQIEAIVPCGSSLGTIIRSDNATAYHDGDVMGNPTTSIITFSDVLLLKSASFKVECIWILSKLNTSVPAGMEAYVLHLYNASPTNIADGAVWALAAADADKYLGSITTGNVSDIGDAIYIQTSLTGFQRRLKTDSNTLYGFLVTTKAHTPVAKADFNVHLETKLV